MENSPRPQADHRPREEPDTDVGPTSSDYPRDRPRDPRVLGRAAAEDTLDEVQTYLQELLGRYGRSESKPADRPAPAPRLSEQKTDPIGITPPAIESPPESQRLRSLPDPKRPPERRGDILALRELSTRSARGAIAQFDAGRIVAATWARFWLCFAALGLTLFFLRVVEPFTLRTLCAAAVALVLAIYWCGQFWLLTRQATRIGTRTSKAGRTARAT